MQEPAPDQAPQAGPRARVEAAALACIAAGAAAAAYVAYGYGLSKDDLPGAGLYPAIVAIACVALALLEAVLTLGSAKGGDAEEPYDNDDPPDWAMAGIQWRKLAVYLGAFALLLAGFRSLGFFVSAGAAIMVIMILAERWGWLRSLLITCGLLLSIHVIFVLGLQVQFPNPTVLQQLFR